MKRFCMLEGRLKSMEGNEGSHENDGNMVGGCTRPGNVGMEYTADQEDATSAKARDQESEMTKKETRES